MAALEKEFDIFISHASEDKDSFVRPLALALKDFGVSVWYDEFSLRVGDSLSRSIDMGIARSKYGLVIISPHFISKRWTEHELRGLVFRDVEEGRVILPIWHGVSKEQVKEFSPSLADKIALNTAGTNAQDIAIQLLKEVRPDLYEKHPRAELERLAGGEAVRQLQKQIEEAREELASAHAALSEYRCSYCGAPLASRDNVPLDDTHDDWGNRESFECGFTHVDGEVTQPIPAIPYRGCATRLGRPLWLDF